MLKIIFFVMISCTATYSQEQLSDQELKEQLYVYLIEMESRGASHSELQDAFFTEKERYVKSREGYYRFSVYMKYMYGKITALKSNIGEDAPNGLLSKLNRTYKEYLEFKKTDGAKENWENSTHNGVLRLVVNDIKKLTPKEQKRHDDLLELLHRDSFFHSFVIADMQQVTTVATTKE